MIRYNKQIMKEGKCAVCNSPVMVDEGGNGDVCENCGWCQDAASNEIPGNVWGANLISLDKARKLYKEGNAFKPEFDDYIAFYESNGEIEFKLNGIIYGMAKTDDDSIQFWACNVPLKERKPTIFVNVEDFMANAKVNDVLLKDLWDNVENFGLLQ